MRTPAGFVYERSWLEDVLAQSGGLDPITAEPLKIADCVAQDALRAIADAFREQLASRADA